MKYAPSPSRIVVSSTAGPGALTPGPPAETAPTRGGPPAPVSAAVSLPPVRSRSRRPVWGAVGAVAGAAVVVVAVLWIGSTPASSPGNGVPFSSGEVSALAAVTAQFGGSWSALGAVGMVQEFPGEISATDLSELLGAGCTATSLNGSSSPAPIIIPTSPGGFDSGLAPLWLFFVAGPASDGLVVVEVLNGSAVPIDRIGGSGCSASSMDRPLPGGTLDSPAVAATAWADDGKGWVTGDSALRSLTMAVFGGGSYSGVVESGLWAFVYAPCNPLGGGTVSMPIFVALLNLTTGSLTGSIPYHVGCPS